MAPGAASPPLSPDSWLLKQLTRVRPPDVSAHTAGSARAVDEARAMSGGLITIACGQEATARSEKMVSADDHLRSIHTDHWKQAARVAEASTTVHNLRSGGAGGRGASSAVAGTRRDRPAQVSARGGSALTLAA
jgi:hypothetical protein